jgi:hypothetical protein
MNSKQNFNGKEVLQLLKMKPEIEQNIQYGKKVIEAKHEQLKALKRLIDKGRTLFFIPVGLSDYQKAKYKSEYAEIERELYYKQKFYHQWLTRQNDFNSKYEKMVIDFEENFPSTLEQAKGIESNLRLKEAIKNFELIHDELDTNSKVEFFLYIKQEIQNYKNSKKIPRPQSNLGFRKK